MNRKWLLFTAVLMLAACGDSGSDSAQDPSAVASAESQTAGFESTSAADPQTGHQTVETDDLGAISRLSLDQIQQDLDIPSLSEPWKGDFDAMIERRIIRVLTVYGLGRYYLDGPREKGLTYELLKMFEDQVNKKQGKKHVRIHVVFIPVARDELLPALLAGRGDIAAAGLTITPERQRMVDFSDPGSKPLSELLVTGPSAPLLAGIEDLAGKTVHVRSSSSYRASLQALNRQFREQGRPEVVIEEISEFLEDEDLLEMVNAGLLDWAVVDDYKADIWAEVFENLTVREDIVFREGGRIGFAVRKNSPLLLAELNAFLKTHSQGTLKGNILINRYYRDFDWATNALAANDFERFRAVVDIFRKYGDQYGLDFLIVTAQGYQESRLDQSVRSRAGAVGIMQLLPSTAADPNVGIPDISEVEPNIHAGVKYLNFIGERYFSDPAIDEFNRTLFALASYNAGPARVRKLRDQAVKQGYDPNLWFDNVEVVAAKEIGRETVQYVSNIVKYYVAYRLSVIRQLQRASERESMGIDQGN